MTKKLGIIALIIFLFLVVLSPASAQVQGQIAVTDSTAQVDFPLKLTFSSKIASDAGITDVRLRYKVDQMSFADVVAEALVEFAPGRSVNARWAFELRKIGGMPPGTSLEYWWVAKDGAGHIFSSPHQMLQFNDNRYTWRDQSQEKVTLFWYNGDASFAQELMTTAQLSLARLAKDTGAVLEMPVKIYIYAGSKDLQAAMVFPQEWTGGVTFAQNSVIAIGITPSNLVWGKRAMTHELAHMVFYQMTVNPYNEPPVWLNEGFAMYAEGSLEPSYTAQLARAIANNKLISVRSLSSPFSAYTDISLQSYAQSFSLVDYLISQYGSDKMLSLLNTFKQGSGYDEAFSKVYGFDMDGLNALWRSYVIAQYSQVK